VCSWCELYVLLDVPFSSSVDTSVPEAYFTAGNVLNVSLLAAVLGIDATRVTYTTSPGSRRLSDTLLQVNCMTFFACVCVGRRIQAAPARGRTCSVSPVIAVLTFHGLSNCVRSSSSHHPPPAWACLSRKPCSDLLQCPGCLCQPFQSFLVRFRFSFHGRAHAFVSRRMRTLQASC
jgi:hypothetical protein